MARKLGAELIALAEACGVVTFRSAISEVSDAEPGTPGWSLAYRKTYHAVHYLAERGRLQADREAFWLPTLSGQRPNARSAMTARIAREFWELHVLTGEKFAQLQRVLGIEPPSEADPGRPAAFPLTKSARDVAPRSTNGSKARRRDGRLTT